MSLGKHSKVLIDDVRCGAAVAMLRASGLRRADQYKPRIAIGTVGFEGNPCNMHLRGLGDEVKRSLPSTIHGSTFSTIGVSDGITMGTTGMRYSLPSRELISDCVETMINAHHYDGSILIPGCDKNMPGMLIGAIRSDRPAVMIYGGSTKPGHSTCNNNKLDIVSAFQAYGQLLSEDITQSEYDSIIDNAIPGAGACGGMYTANSMAVILEILGITPINSSSNPAVSEEKLKECKRAGQLMEIALKHDIRPSQLITKESLLNCIRVSNALGASTNIVLHLLAIANEARIDLTYDDFIREGKKTPLLANLKPSGDYLMYDLHTRLNGISPIVKYLIENEIIDGSTTTIEGVDLRTRLKDLEFKNTIHNNNDMVRWIENPILPSGHIRILKGSLAPNGAVAKISGKEGSIFKGPAKVYDSEELMISALEAGNINKGDVIVIRYVGPKRGMPEMLRPTSAVVGLGLKDHVALITDGRFSGGSHGFIVGHVEPEADMHGPIALIKNGDIIEINSISGTIDVMPLGNTVLDNRVVEPPPLEAAFESGYLAKFNYLAGPASKGACSITTLK